MPSSPTTPFADGGAKCHRSGALIWVPLRSKWVDATRQPEEVVRQEWVRRLVVDGGFELNQMDQERRTQHGHGSPRADIVVWESAAKKASEAAAIMIVETKATEGPVIESDFRQGNSYAVAGGAGFLIAATATAHAVYQLTPGFPGKATQINEWPKKSDFGSQKRLDRLRHSLRAFDRDEFQKLLSDCHDLLRDHHAMTPDKAFDTISKVLFIKLRIERSGNHGTFTTEFLDKREAVRVEGDEEVHERLFEETKNYYRADELFGDNDKLEISSSTFRAIVAKLERFNLSQTGDDIKGIAFEQFLGRTFRGELGQFFTPRPVVDFMVDAINPEEGELICDPAAGSGGFLIRVFDHVRGKISSDIERQKNEKFQKISAEYPPDSTDKQLAERDHRIDEAFSELNGNLRTTEPDGGFADTRVGRLAWNCIYGTDKEPRAARTAKMNMIMHGDGHGGIHWHDGLVNTNGIWEGRFNVIVTNPPFGATVSSSQLVGGTAESDVPDDSAYKRRMRERYGDDWNSGYLAVVNARTKPILETFEIGKGKNSRQTEVMFVERCLRLLKPGGRLAIVLPNGNLNAASLAWLRRWAEGKAYLRGVVALPPETFKFSRASVSASIVFLDRFTPEAEAAWEKAWADALDSTKDSFDEQRDALLANYQQRIVTADGNETLTDLLTRLGALGVTRELPAYTRAAETGLVRGAGTTSIGNAKWVGRGAGDAAALKTEYIGVSQDHKATIKSMIAELRAALKEVDEAQTAAMWTYVREEFDYPVFMATPKSVGITATGDTGPHVANDLPEILEKWREFRAWQANGFPEGGM